MTQLWPAFGFTCGDPATDGLGTVVGSTNGVFDVIVVEEVVNDFNVVDVTVELMAVVVA